MLDSVEERGRAKLAGFSMDAHASRTHPPGSTGGADGAGALDIGLGTFWRLAGGIDEVATLVEETKRRFHVSLVGNGSVRQLHVGCFSWKTQYWTAPTVVGCMYVSHLSKVYLSIYLSTHRRGQPVGGQPEKSRASVEQTGPGKKLEHGLKEEGHYFRGRLRFPRAGRGRARPGPVQVVSTCLGDNVSRGRH